MTKEENYEQVPFYERIVQNGVTRIDSVFEFDNTKALLAFLHVCGAKKSTVEFLAVEDYIRWLLTKARRKED